MNIKIYNHLYATSVKMGGFGTFYASDGLQNEIVKELEKIVSYVSPTGLPQNPSNEEIGNLFPINYAYYKIKNSNSIAILRSKYTGSCNHTPNRFGNFISHSIIFENTEKLNIPVIIENFKFRNSLTVEEEANFKVNTNDLLIDSSKIDYNYYLNFLNNNSKSLNALLNIIDLLINGWLNDASKNITLLGNKEENELIIFSLYTLLPPVLINKYSFATYVSNPSKYPFQITGIIKETGVTHLDSKYFHLIELDKLLSYQIQNEFTSFFHESILKGKYNFNDLNDELEMHNIKNFGKSLNLISKYNSFIFDIKNKTIDDYKRIITPDVSDRIKNKINTESKKENPKLYIDIIVEQFTKKLYYSHNDFRNDLKSFYEEFFYFDINFSSDYFFDFYSIVKEKISLNNKPVLSIYFLNDFKIDNKLFIDKELEIVNAYLENNEFDNEELSNLITKYDNYIKKGSMFNLFKNKKRIEFESLLKEGRLEQCLIEGSDEFKELSNKVKVQILSDFLWSKNIKKKFDLTFIDFKKLVVNYIDAPFEFWITFFKMKFDDKTNEKYSLSYLKRNFILNSLQDESISNLIDKINLNEKEKWWIADYIVENNIELENNVNSCLNMNN